MLSVRRVPEEQKLCKLLLKTARRVGQVIQRSSEHQLHWQRYFTNSVTAHNNKKKQNNGIWLWTGMHKPPHQTLCQICSSGSFQIHWGQENCNLCPENHYCPVRTLPRQRNGICVLWQKKKKSFTCFVTRTFALSESWCESHSVSQWCILPRGQFGPQLLHGDFLP